MPARPPTPPPAGSPVRVRFRKWGDRPHWEYDAAVLGEDEHGTWVGARAGTTVARPGASFVAPVGFVSLLPRDLPFVATFYAPHATGPGDAVELYVDVATVPRWLPGEPDVVEMVDLDLDVVRGRSGRVWVDDEDEFAAHRVQLSYPDDLVALASRSCEEVRSGVVGGAEPFERTRGRDWLTRLGSAAAS